jgi:aminoglycoside 3-N-acetyltransferase
MASLGQVDGGPDAVIDVLLETVGEDGLVVVPTFACDPPFDRRTSPTPLGAIPDRLWRRPNAVRSLHPTHSVAAIGRGAEELIGDHEKAATAYAEGTPYHTLATTGGKILLLGVDQDRNTTLHTAEALSGAVYLTDITGTYVDDNGKQVTIPVAAMAGPHRDFIGLDRLFREHGVMRMGNIGGAVCRLMDAGAMLEVAMQALKQDPAAVLCENPNCADCVMQRGKIKAARLARESFTLAAEFLHLGDNDEEIDEIVAALKGEGISSLEVTVEEYRNWKDLLFAEAFSVAAIRGTPGDCRALELAATLHVPLVVTVVDRQDFDDLMRLTQHSSAQVLMVNDAHPSSFYEELYAEFPDAPRLAFSPAGFAAAGEGPFLDVFYEGKLRKQMEHFYIDDGCWIGPRTLPGQGKGEVKEIISMLRCRSYSGVMTLCQPYDGIDNFRATAAAFWDLLDNM